MVVVVASFVCFVLKLIYQMFFLNKEWSCLDKDKRSVLMHILLQVFPHYSVSLNSLLIFAVPKRDLV